MFTKKYYKGDKTYSRYVSKDKGVIVDLYEGKYSETGGGKAKFFAAHVKLGKKSYDKMHLAKANGKRSNGFQTVYTMVHSKKTKAYNAILAVNGPFNGADSKKWNCFNDGKYYTAAYHNYHEIVNWTYHKGTLGANKVSGDATYCSKTGLLRPGTLQKGVTAGMTLSDAAKKKLISDTFHGDMGMALLNNGKLLAGKADKGYRPRTFIGTNGKPGDFWIVVCNGDNADKWSKGLNSYGEAQILKKLGCNYGYNLDGGGSSTMIFKGKIVNKQIQLRKCYDCLYVKR